MYNGWTNYETWAVALWLGNEEPSYLYWRDVAQECWDDAEAGDTFSREDVATWAMADRLKDEFAEGKEAILDAAKASCSVWGDLLGAALSEVNWDEIARHYVTEAAEAASR